MHIYIESCATTEDVVACLVQCSVVVEVCWLHSRSITSQSLCLEGGGDLNSLLSSLTLPSLMYLRLKAVSPRTPGHWTLEDLFERSSCPLVSFVVGYESLNPQAFDQRSIVSYFTIPFIKSVLKKELYLPLPESTLQEMMEALLDPTT